MGIIKTGRRHLCLRANGLQRADRSQKLLKEGIEVSVINLHTIKPLDKTLIELMAKKAGAIFNCGRASKAWWDG